MTTRMFIQEIIAFLIVALAFGYLALNAFRNYAALPFSEFLLKRGRVKIAFWVKKFAPKHKAGCSSCKNC
jgi:hypothetical protein